jgi:SurA-like N-terminal domain/PPIC-type PPIASE domain
MLARLWMLPLAVLAAALVACGSSSSSNGLASGDVAVVDGIHITKTQLDHQIAILMKTKQLQHQAVPKAGTTGYKSEVIDATVQTLVLAAEVHRIADQLGVTVPDSRVRSNITAAIKRAYQGDRSKYLAAIKKYGITEQDVFDQFQVLALEQAIGKKLAGEVPVNNQTALAYYNSHKSTYVVPDDTRKVNYILVDRKSTADKALSQLRAGKAEAQVAQGAIDSNALHQPVQPFTVTKSSGDEQNFVNATFSIPTGAWSQPVPVSKSYTKQRLSGRCKPTCYFLIDPIGDVVKKGTQRSFAEVKSQILAQLKGTTQAQHVQEREKALVDALKKKITYAPDYAPPPSSTTPATTSSTATS